jgi:methoxymalonate biosynthesis protein
VPDEPVVIKCLIWDLDHTLWQGTLLEDPDVRLPDEVRNVIVTLDARGILQSIASKNDHDLAWARLEELGVAEYFVHPRINWGRKSDSVTAIAEQLNFALTTIAFVDDLPSERAEVAFRAPEVRCYSADQVTSLLSRPEFRPATVTADARRRRQMYQAGIRREAEKQSFAGPDEEFLRTLDLVMTIKRADQEELSRVEELTLRTSQMNATGVHYSGEVLRRLLDDPAHEVLTVALTDRFGPHGAVGVLLLEYRDMLWHLKLLATSCRVVSFGAGAAILNWLIDQAARGGAHLAADFRPTDRNRMMEVAYRFAGFTSEACACLTQLGPDGGGDIQHLHLQPAFTIPATTMKLISPDLSAGRVAGQAGPAR